MAKHSPKFVEIVEQVRSNIRECTIHDVKLRLDQHAPIVLVDVREESEFAAGHLPGAKHISKDVIERDIEVAFPDPTTEIHLYCGGGYRSALAADNLRKMGYTNVISVDGGWRAWTEAGYPTEK